MILTGCQTTGENSKANYSEEFLIDETGEALNEGRYYQAKKLTREFLEDHPENEQAQALMAKILEQEIAAQKEVFQSRIPEELSDSDKDDQIRTWLERASSLLRQKQYSQAMAAAEEVFTLDPENVKASKLVDAIRTEALNGQVGDKKFLKEMREDELSVRAERYKRDAEAFLAKGQFGAAELSIKKVLLIFPEDKEANQIYQRIQIQEEGSQS